MLDRKILGLTRGVIDATARMLVAKGACADHITWLGFALGLGAVPLIALQHECLAIVLILLNRVADGIDGAVARLTHPTDRGAFLDIALDFLFYSSIPLAFALANPPQNALAAATLIYTFVGTGSTFLAFAIIAAKRGISSTAYPEKGFYYLGGLTEASETIFVFVLMCLFSDWFAALAYGFAALCALTAIARIVSGVQLFKDAKD